MSCAEGEITGLLGLNGAGKTTVLKAVCARHFATGGEVVVDGVSAGESPEIVRNLTGFVQEEPDLPGEYTVAEYLGAVASLHGAGRGVSPWLTDSLSLGPLLNKKIRSLSKGQKGRVNLAQALVYNPGVLVLDEPSSGLDPAQIVSMRSLIRSLKAGRTILLSTHLMQEAVSLCDRIFIIHEGNLAAAGTPDEITAGYGCGSLEEAFMRITGGEGAGSRRGGDLG